MISRKHPRKISCCSSPFSISFHGCNIKPLLYYFPGSKTPEVPTHTHVSPVPRAASILTPGPGDDSRGAPFRDYRRRTLALQTSRGLPPTRGQSSPACEQLRRPGQGLAGGTDARNTCVRTCEGRAGQSPSVRGLACVSLRACTRTWPGAYAGA